MNYGDNPYGSPPSIRRKAGTFSPQGNTNALNGVADAGMSAAYQVKASEFGATPLPPSPKPSATASAGASGASGPSPYAGAIGEVARFAGDELRKFLSPSSTTTPGSWTPSALDTADFDISNWGDSWNNDAFRSSVGFSGAPQTSFVPDTSFTPPPVDFSQPLPNFGTFF